MVLPTPVSVPVIKNLSSVFLLLYNSAVKVENLPADIFSLYQMKDKIGHLPGLR